MQYAEPHPQYYLAATMVQQFDLFFVEGLVLEASTIVSTVFGDKLWNCWLAPYIAVYGQANFQSLNKLMKYNQGFSFASDFEIKFWSFNMS
jgi:hypothetical protein